MIDELGLYLLTFDRASGYEESDPNLKRSAKSEALDIQELVDDQLQLGHMFYVIGTVVFDAPLILLRYIQIPIKIQI